jgi:hypothetical protein
MNFLTARGGSFSVVPSLEDSCGGADVLKPRRLVGDPVGHLVAAAIAS